MIRVRGKAELADVGPGRATVGIRASLTGPEESGDASRRGRLRRVAGRTFPRRLEIDLSLEITGDVVLCLEVSADAIPIHWRELGVEQSGDAAAVAEFPALPAKAVTGPVAGTPINGPLFSILTPVHDPPLDILAETIDSVLAQTYEDWELCLVDDGSTDPEVTAALERAAAADTRIQMHRRDRAGGISTATNAALEMAHGEFIALLDHDDVLAPEALATVAALLDESPSTDMFYSDEELLADRGPNHVFAKPHWSPDLLRSQMYTCHLGVYRRALATEIGGFRSGFDGSQDFDFALRFTERTDQVVHVPQILYRWRVHAGSSAGSTQAKPAAYPAARRALTEHLERTGTRGEAFFGPWQGIYRIVHELPADTRIAVGTVGLGDAPHLATALSDQGRNPDHGVELLSAPSAAALVDSAPEVDVIVLIDGDVEPLTHGWVSRLAAFALQPGVAAVGARTLSPDGLVENGALAIDHALPIPILLGAGAGDPGPLGIGIIPSNASAVAGVVAIPIAALREVGGLDPGAGDLAVPDYCLRALVQGRRIVSAPDVLLRRHGPGPVNDLPSLDRFRRRWSTEVATDPYIDQAASRPSVGANG